MFSAPVIWDRFAELTGAVRPLAAATVGAALLAGQRNALPGTMAPPGTMARRPAAPPTVPDRLDRIGALLDAAVAGGRIPGAVAVVGRGPVTLGRWVTGQADAMAANGRCARTPSSISPR